MAEGLQSRSKQQGQLYKSFFFLRKTCLIGLDLRKASSMMDEDQCHLFSRSV